MASVDIPRTISALYRALYDTTSVSETLEVGEELHDALGHWLEQVRETHSRRLASEEAEQREIADFLRRERESRSPPT